MKGMILAAGKGTRLRPLTARRSKPMVPVANQPLISYPLNSLRRAGITDITIVAGQNCGELRDGLEALAGNVQLNYAVQNEPLGLAHAVQAGYRQCHDGDFVLLFCDNLFSEPLDGALRRWHELSAEHHDLGAMIHVIEVEDPRAFGVAQLEGDWVVALEEKPAHPRSNLAVVGIDIFKPVIFEAILRIRPSSRGELEITDAIQELINMGFRVWARRLGGFWYDTGSFADLIAALQPVMDLRSGYQAAGRMEACELNGELELPEGASLSNCSINGPVIVGEGAMAEGCRLGPYVTLGAGVQLSDCRLDNTQVLDGTICSGLQESCAIIDQDHILKEHTKPFD